MKSPLSLDLTYISEAVSEQEIQALSPLVEKALRSLLEKTGRGSDYLGWIELPFVAQKQLGDLRKAAKALKSCESVVSVGIGGSYLGIKATIEAMGGSDKIHYAGNHLSPTYFQKLMKKLNPKKTGIVVISKSGTTTEPAVAFRILKTWLEKAVGKKSQKPDSGRDRSIQRGPQGDGGLGGIQDFCYSG
jgi:glucose-6-phosphate isomerase